MKGRGVKVDLLVDAAAFMPAILDAIRSAERQVLVETYLIRSDETGKQVIDALCEKAKSGVAVWAVFDAFGSGQLNGEDQRRMRDAGVHLRMFNRVRLAALLRAMVRTHRRLVVIDGKLGFVGGFGFADPWTKEVEGGPWYELVWQVRGEALRHMAESFRRSWRKRGAMPELLDFERIDDGSPYVILNKSQWGSPHLRRVMLRRLRRARKRIWIATAYFVPPLYMVAALRRAARQGVDVRILLPGGMSDAPAVLFAGRSYYHILLEAGVKIYETRNRMLHAKAFIIDDREAAVGSSNLDNWSLRYNREFNLLVADRDAVREVADAIKNIQADSEQITLDNWQRRSFWGRTLELFFRMVDRLL